jgi:hypothetical protein
MRWLLQTVPLVLFWLVLSGHYTLLLLSLGAVSTALVVALTRRAGVADVRVTARRLVRLPWYFAWLGGQAGLESAERSAARGGDGAPALDVRAEPGGVRELHHLHAGDARPRRRR